MVLREQWDLGVSIHWPDISCRGQTEAKVQKWETLRFRMEERINELAVLMWVETWLNKAVGRLGR